MAESREIVWSLGCDVTIEDFDSSIEEIKVGDISLSGVVSVGELPVDVDSDRVNVMDLDVSFSVDGVHSTIIESQVVPHARIVEIESYSPEATNEKRYAASAYAAKKILDSLTETNNNVSKNENAIGNLQTAVNELEKKVDEGGTGSGDSHWYLSNDGKIHTDYDIVVHGNAIIEGDTASGGEGEDITVGLDEQAVLDLLEREGYVTEDDIAGLVPEVDLSDYYKATQVDDLLSKKVNTKDVYTKEELNPYKSWWDKLMAHITVDENGNVVIDPNLMVVGDVASGDEGEDVVIGGISGVKVNGVTYYDDNGDGIVDLGTISGGSGTADLSNYYTKAQSDARYLALSGGTLDGNLTIGYDGSTTSQYFFRMFRNIGSTRNRLLAAILDDNTIELSYYSPTSGGYGRLVLGASSYKVGNSTLYDIIHSGNIGSYAFVPKSDDLVSNVNADNYLSNGVYLNQTGNGSGNSNFPSSYSAFLTFSQSSKYAAQISIGNNAIHMRRKIDSWSHWMRIIAENENGNVLIGTTIDSGYKLDVNGKIRFKACTIWGQSFDGTKDISGALSGVTSITLSGSISPTSANVSYLGEFDNYFRKAYINVISGGAKDNNLWLVGGNNTSSVGIQFARSADGSTNGKIGTWDATGLYPAANNAYSLGETSHRWSTIYGVKGVFDNVHLGSKSQKLNTVGWEKVAIDNKKMSYSTVIINIERVYNSTNNEVYTFLISCAYQGQTTITQIGGHANYRAITQIAVYNPASPYDRAIYIYYNTTASNTTHVNCVGDFDAITPEAATLPSSNVKTMATLASGFATTGNAVIQGDVASA